jgi:DNA-binding transcriptional ArsR family regulator
MGAGLHIAEVANLVGDPARANILAALLDQRALTASELAYAAGVSPQTTSSHLGKLAQAHLLEVEKQGRLSARFTARRADARIRHGGLGAWTAARPAAGTL